MAINLKITEIGNVVNVFASARGSVFRLLKDAVDDIADEIEDLASHYAPITEDPDSKSPRGLLKSHPVDREDTGRATASSPGHDAATSVITVAEYPEYAIWVHDGTGPKFAHTPKGMSYKSFGVKYKGLMEVGGNPEQPYLLKAAQKVDATYMPARMAQLRLELAALPGIKVSSGIIATTHIRGGKPVTVFRSKGRFTKAP